MLDAKRVIGGGLIAGALLVGGPAGLALADSHGGGEPGKPGNSTEVNTTVTTVNTTTTNSGQSGNSGGSGNNTSIRTWESNYTTTVNRIRDSFNTDNSRNLLSRNVFANGNLSGNNVAIFSNNKVTIVAFSLNGNSH